MNDGMQGYMLTLQSTKACWPYWTLCYRTKALSSMWNIYSVE